MARITYLEDVLHEDAEGTAMTALVRKLERAESELMAQSRRPLTAAQYRMVERARAATAAAREVIACVWQRYHSPGVEMRGTQSGMPKKGADSMR